MSLLLSGCGGGGETGTGAGGKIGSGDLSGRLIKVVATTGIIGDAAANVGGERVTVVNLMGPGIDPHLYKANEGDVRRLGEADIIFYNGLHLEARMATVLAQMNRSTRTVAVAEAVAPDRLLTPAEFEGAHDPHIWFDMALWMESVTAIRDVFIELDPLHSAVYEETSARYLREMEQLHAYVKEQAESLPRDQRILITAHDAFNYFGRAYGFEVRGLQGISTASEAGTGDVQDLAAEIAERRIGAIFVETSVSPRTIEAVQAAVRSRGFDVAIGGELFSDALGDPGSEAGTYLGMARYNIDTIVEALGRASSHRE